MENCLVLKLKEVVNNNNLKKLGVFDIERLYVENEVQSDTYIGIDRSVIPSGESIKLTLVGGGHFMTTYGGEPIEDGNGSVTISSGSGTTTLYTSNGNYAISVENEYYAKLEFATASKCYKINISDIYFTKINRIRGNGYYGNLADLNPDNIKYIELREVQKTSVHYKSEDYAKLSNLETLTIQGNGWPEIELAEIGKCYKLNGTQQFTGIGNIEDFVTAQRAVIVDGQHPRATFSGTLNLKWLGATNKVYFGGSLIQYNIEGGLLTWTADTITFRGVTIDA